MSRFNPLKRISNHIIVTRKGKILLILPLNLLVILLAKRVIKIIPGRVPKPKKKRVNAANVGVPVTTEVIKAV